MTDRPETVETVQWDNRELLLRIYYQTVETNGSVRQHDRELYGDVVHGTTGLVAKVDENCLWRQRADFGWKVAAAIGGTLTTLIVTLLVIVLQKGLG